MHQRFILTFLFLISLLVGNTQDHLRDSLTSIITSSSAPDSSKINAYIALTEDPDAERSLQEIESARALINQIYEISDQRKKYFLDESRIHLHLNEASYYFIVNSDFEKAVSIVTECIKEAKVISSDMLLGTCHNNLAVMQYSMGETENCLINLREGVRYREKVGNKFDIAQSYSNLGLILFRSGRQNEALEYLYKALAICDEIKDFAQKASTLHYLGQVYNQQKDYKRELRTSLEALDLYQKYGTPREISSGYNNLGSLYQTLGKFDSSYYYHSKALELRRSLSYQHGIANSQNNIGNLHRELGDFNAALTCYREAKEIWEGNENIESLSTLYMNIATVFRETNNVDSTLYYAQKGFDLGKDIQSYENIALSGELVSWAFEQKQDFKNALFYFKEYHAANDSLFNDLSRSEAERQVLNFEFQSKETQLKAEQEKKDALSAAQLQGQKRIRNISIAALVLAILLALLAFNRYRIKQKAAIVLAEQNKIVEAARLRAEQSEKSKQQFLANMSHEVRTPMNAIIGMSKLLQDHQHDDKSNQYIQAIRHSGENLLVILNDILDLSKIEAGQMSVEKVVFNLHSELKLLQDTYQTRAIEKGITLQLFVDEAVPIHVKNDVSRLNQILSNLLNNAIKFTEKGHVSLHVESLPIEENQSSLRFIVEDSGIGIEHDKLSTIFESFKQANTSDSRLYGGTGLGLTISKQLAELLGGELYVESQLGVGSKFILILPVEIPLISEISAVESSSELKKDDRIISILLAEDNDYNAIVAGDTLKKYFPNSSVFRARNGKDVINLLENNSMDIILMDVQMPVMDGYETTRNIRKRSNSKYQSIPILALTASVIRTDLDKCLEAGMNGYLAKPFRDEDLLKGIKDVLMYKTVRMEESTVVTNQNEKYIKLFKQIVPERLALVEKALKASDKLEVKRLVHLMRPQLQSAQVLVSDKEYDIIENFTPHTEEDVFRECTLRFIVTVKDHLKEIES